MFLRYFITIPRPAEEIESVFERGVANWMPTLVEEMNGQGNRLLSELGFEIAGGRIQRRIKIDVRPGRRTAGATLIPISWRAASASALFPVLDGQLEIASLGPKTTQLGISANYEPPLGLVGKIADRALLHRVAEVTVKDFLEAIGRRVESGEA